MRLTMNLNNLLVMAVALVGIASQLKANLYAPPPGLQIGDKYRLVFLTAEDRTAASSDINDYNAFVSNAAKNSWLGNLSVSWKAIASTTSIDAIDNIGQLTSTVGVYRTDGFLFANGTAEIFSPGFLYPGILTEDAVPGRNYAWTGTTQDGHRSSAPLGGVFVPNVGIIATMGETGTPARWLFHINDGVIASLPLYAISEEITVLPPPPPAPAPEPGTIGLTALGVGTLFLTTKWKRRR